MPLINGMKMACEPCIRGHRSTKCNHANERLMVPVRKPGRPLTTCPHPRHQMCDCSSVTAAIPRIQTCQCGSNLPLNNGDLGSITNSPSSSETPRSPNRSNFRIEKNYQRPHINTRKPSISNLERMDARQIYLHQLLSTTPLPTANEYHSAVDSPEGYLIPQYMNTLNQYPHTSMNLHPQSFITNRTKYIDKSDPFTDERLRLRLGLNGNTNSTSLSPSGYLTEESPNCFNESTYPDSFIARLNGNAKSPQNEARSCCGSLTMSNGHSTGSAQSTSFSRRPNVPTSVQSSKIAQPSRCCMSKSSETSRPSIPSSVLEPEGAEIDDCCSSNFTQSRNHDPVSTVNSQSSARNGSVFHPPLYPYTPESNVSANSTIYGSFSNPLDASVWRMSQQGTSSQSFGQSSALSSLNAAPLPEIISAAHHCLCGAKCQCIGCVAHPYNDATLDYVRSAWENMSVEHSSCTNKSPLNYDDIILSENGNSLTHKNLDANSSPSLPAPLSPPNNEEEQSLSENNFFFFKYSFPPKCHEEDNGDTSCSKDCGCAESNIYKDNLG